MFKLRFKRIFMFSAMILLSIGYFCTASAQPEVMAWGNLNGIRVQGELLEFETSLSVIGASLRQVSQTAKEQQRPRYERENGRQIVTTTLGGIEFVESVKDVGDGAALIIVNATATADTSISGAFFCLELPDQQFADASIDFIDSTASGIDPIPVFAGRRWSRFNLTVQAKAKGVSIASASRQLELTINEPAEVLIQPGSRFFGNSNTRIYFGVMPGAVTKGQSAEKTFTLKASGEINTAPIHMRLQTQTPGRVFDGIGGNFRLQNPELDMQVINYNLENLNVTWGRVEMPWSSWHPVESVNPLEAARAGEMSPRVKSAMEMAQRLSKQGMPVIVSAWYPPQWAVVEEQAEGLRGNALDQSKMQSIIRSLTSYMLYLKEAYGVEAAMFSFNESDLGINVRQTGEEHAELIKTLGSYMASQGLATKMLLGDNSDANTYAFVEPAINDLATHEYIGAISFHSWRGFDNWTLSIWADLAEQLNVPLLVGEGSVDAAAHRYPDIFLQPTYALNEIDIYVRIAKICQARSILQWQLTSDYSVLTGAGIFGTEGKLRPTQRFWNLKQFGLTPSGSFYLPLISDGADVSCVAMGDIANGIYSIHIVNNGARRQVTLEGLPELISELRIYRTDADRSMQKGESIQVTNGTVRFQLDSACFTSLISE